MTDAPRLRRYHHSNAFTLIELLVVISIITMLISILLPALSAARDTARSVVCLGAQRQVGMMMINYAGDYNDHLPPARLHTALPYNSGTIQFTDSPTSYNMGFSWAALLAYKGYASITIPPGSSQSDNRHQPGWEIFACDAAPNRGLESTHLRGIPGYRAQHISFGYNYREIGGSHHLADQFPADNWKWYISATQTEIVDPSNKLLTIDTIGTSGSPPAANDDPPRGLSRVADAAATSEPGRPHARHRGAANIAWVDGHATSVRSPNPDDLNGMYAVLGIGGEGFAATERNVWSRSGPGLSVK